MQLRHHLVFRPLDGLANAPVNQLPSVTWGSIGARNQSLILAADIIWRFESLF